MHPRLCRLFPVVLASFLLSCTNQLIAATPTSGQTPNSSRLGKSYRFERAHWIYVHLEGKPADVGYQHGWLLAPEIEDGLHAFQLEDTHRTKRDWQFFRKTAQEVLWPHLDAEYQQELKGITEGLNAHGGKADLWDIVALNGMEEVSDYYVPLLDKQQHVSNPPRLFAPGNCSAFVATGSWTKDHKPVIAHNNWTSVINGSRWRIVYDIVPEHGQRILMDGFPGIIASDDDFGINGAGLMVTETTITGFSGFDPKGKPEFERARKALQYATSIDEYVKIMLEQNNGGYANDWLLADNKTGEVARFELGLKNHRVWRTKDGYFEGSNFPSDPKFIKEETNFDVKDLANSPNARKKRWAVLMEENKGKIDAELAQKFLADHWDTYENKEARNERPLCGHIDVSAHGVPEWGWDPYDPAGAVNAKATDASLAKQMGFWARSGHPCGEDFLAEPFLKAHPEYEWERSILPDMKGNPWGEFKAGDTK